MAYYYWLTCWNFIGKRYGPTSVKANKPIPVAAAATAVATAGRPSESSYT